MGFLFMGTSKFRAPGSFIFKSRRYTLSLPSEPGLNYDFINLILDDEYGIEKLDAKPKTIVDIGANIGLFSLWAGACFPKAIIHSYEPNARLHPYLVTNLKQVGAKIFAEGVGSRACYGELVDPGESRLGTCHPSESGDIPLVSLRTVIARMGGHIDLLKLDCEGAEWDILKDLDAFQDVTRIHMEYHLAEPGQTVEKLIAIFRHAGFQSILVDQNQGFGIAWFKR